VRFLSSPDLASSSLIKTPSDFVTGFRRRKLERKKKYEEKLKEQQRLDKIEERKQVGLSYVEDLFQ
jgi:hypothetical protein